MFVPLAKRRNAMAMFDKHKDGKQDTPEAPPARVAPPPTSVSTAPTGGSEKSTMIGRGIRIAGDVTADSNLRVEGVIEGRSIESSHDVDIGDSGKVTASISAKVVRIAGEVTGDVAGGEKVTISKSGRVQGNVTAPRVQLEDGALFRGSIDMNPTKAADTAPTSADKRSATTKAAVVEADTRKESGLTLKSG
jgi:cytoskeletal protein CcmA (bactofilin family)